MPADLVEDSPRDPQSDPDSDDKVTSNPNVIQPKRRWIVEPVCLLFCIGMFSQSPVVSQFIYYKTGLHYNASVDSSRAHVCDTNSSANSSDHELTNKIQAEASTWTLSRSTVGSVVALFVLPFYASASDYLGRKPVILLPAIGLAVDAVGVLLVALLNLPLSGLVVSSGLGALGGGYGTMFAGMFAYLADTTSRKVRPIRIFILEAMFGVAGALLELIMGWWIRLMGYTVPLIFSAVVVLANVAYVFFFVPEVRRRANDAKTVGLSWLRLALLPIVNIGCLFRDGARQSALLGLLLVSMGIFSMSFIGSIVVGSLYQMNFPFCLDSVSMGYLGAVKIVAYQVGAVLGLMVFRKYLGVKTIGLIVIGLASSALGSLTTGLATSTPILYVGAVVSMFSMLSIPMFRAYTSQLAPAERQGALFSCIGVLEVLGSLAGAAGFTLVYRSTLTWMPGFVYIVACIATALALGLTALCFLVDRCLPAEQVVGAAVLPELEEAFDDTSQMVQ